MNCFGTAAGVDDFLHRMFAEVKGFRDVGGKMLFPLFHPQRPVKRLLKPLWAEPEILFRTLLHEVWNDGAHHKSHGEMVENGSEGNCQGFQNICGIQEEQQYGEQRQTAAENRGSLQFPGKIVLFHVGLYSLKLLFQLLFA